MKILFLDFDGVLNNSWWIKFCRQLDKPDHEELKPQLVERLNEVLRRTGAKVVVSSSWRWDFPNASSLQALLESRGFVGEVIDRTPFSQECDWIAPLECQRGMEIKTWLEWNPDVTVFAIVDDIDEFSKFGSEQFVQTTMDDGLTEEAVERLIKILGEDT